MPERLSLSTTPPDSSTEQDFPTAPNQPTISNHPTTPDHPAAPDQLPTPSPESLKHSKLDTPFLQKYQDYIELDSRGELTPIGITGISQSDYEEVKPDTRLDKFLPDQALAFAERNHRAITHNLQTLDEANHLITEYSRISPADREFLFNSSEITGREKAYIFLIETARQIAEVDYHQLTSPDMSVAFNQLEFINNFKDQTAGIYALESVYAQHLLELSGARFNILPEGSAEPDSLEDAASCALESFVMHPNYRTERILEYEDFLRGLELDCTRKRLIGDDPYGNPQFTEEVDVDEFRARVLESIGENVMYDGRTPSKSEQDAIYREMEDKQIAALTGRYFKTDAENRGIFKYSDSPDYGFLHRHFNDEQTKERDAYAEHFRKKARTRIARTEEIIFHADRALADAETAPLAGQIDYASIIEINDNNELPIEDKLTQIAAVIQSALGIQNLDESGHPQPIKTGWLRTKLPGFIRKFIKLSAGAKESSFSTSGCYYHDEKTFYIKKPPFGRQKFNPSEIDTIAHELFHAYQHEVSDSAGSTISTTDKKARDYFKNNLGYAKSGIFSAFAYEAQLTEVEAYAFGANVKARFRHHSIGRAALAQAKSGEQ